MKYAYFSLIAVAILFSGCTKKESSRTLSSELGGAVEVDSRVRPTPQSGSNQGELIEVDASYPDEPLGHAVRESLRPEMRPADLDTTRRREPEYKAALPITNTTFNTLCRDFIARDGSLGPWGRRMVEAMRAVERSKGTAIFFGNGPNMVKMGSRCRSTEYFKSLTRAQQEHIWVWFWASTAQAESSCRPWAQVGGIRNTTLGHQNIADGLFQLEYRTSTRRANGRSTRFCPSDTNTQAITYQMECAASTMADTQAGKFLKDETPRRYANGNRRWGYTYWQKLRSPSPEPDKQIFNLFKRHPLCR